MISRRMIKSKLLLAAILVTSILIPAAVRAIGIDIQVGDRPYYNHGARYWDGDYQMVWVAGHMSNGNHWVHGHYVRGEHRQHEVNGHHDDHQDDDRR